MKIVKAVSNCNECPNRLYGSGGLYDCAAAGDAPLIEGVLLPEWCPLPNHASEIAARALYALNNAKLVLETAQGEAQKASPERLRDLIKIAAEQVARL